jgi:hypothetical protein
MARGIWSFLHEWAIYEYLMTRFEEKALRFKAVRSSGKYVGREKWVAVSRLHPIKDSQCLQQSRNMCQASTLLHVILPGQER